MDPKDIELVKQMIGDGLKPVTDQVATIAGSIEPLTKQLTEMSTATKTLTETVTALKATPPADDKNKGKGKDGNSDEMPAWAKELKESVEAIAKPVGEITAEREKTAKQRAAEALVLKYLDDNKLGGLKLKKAVLDRLIAGNPTKPEEVKALVDAERAYAASLGIPADKFGADPAAEGGKAGEGGAETIEAKKAKTAENIKKAAEAHNQVL